MQPRKNHGTVSVWRQSDCQLSKPYFQWKFLLQLQEFQECLALQRSLFLAPVGAEQTWFAMKIHDSSFVAAPEISELCPAPKGAKKLLCSARNFWHFWSCNERNVVNFHCKKGLFCKKQIFFFLFTSAIKASICLYTILLMDRDLICRQKIDMFEAFNCK